MKTFWLTLLTVSRLLGICVHLKNITRWIVFLHLPATKVSILVFQVSRIGWMGRFGHHIFQVSFHLVLMRKMRLLQDYNMMHLVWFLEIGWKLEKSLSTTYIDLIRLGYSKVQINTALNRILNNNPVLLAFLSLLRAWWLKVGWWLVEGCVKIMRYQRSKICSPRQFLISDRE